jgi:hypothetical protein
MKKRLANRRPHQQLSTTQAKGCRGGALACGENNNIIFNSADGNTYYGTEDETTQTSYETGMDGPYSCC